MIKMQFMLQIFTVTAIKTPQDHKLRVQIEMESALYCRFSNNTWFIDMCRRMFPVYRPCQ